MHSDFMQFRHQLLIDAVRTGNIGLVIFFLKNKFDPFFKDFSTNQSALNSAILNKKTGLNCIILFIENTEYSQQRNAAVLESIIEAANQDNLDAFKMLVEHYQITASRNPFYWIPSHYLSFLFLFETTKPKKQHEECCRVLEFFIRNGVSLEEKNEYEQTAFESLFTYTYTQSKDNNQLKVINILDNYVLDASRQEKIKVTRASRCWEKEKKTPYGEEALRQYKNTLIHALERLAPFQPFIDYMTNQQLAREANLFREVFHNMPTNLSDEDFLDTSFNNLQDDIPPSSRASHHLDKPSDHGHRRKRPRH